MTKEDIQRFLDLTKHDENPEYPYIREYRRFLKKCYEEKEGKAMYPGGKSPKKRFRSDYNLTNDMANMKDNEWWFRQKYKLMMAMKKNFRPASPPQKSRSPFREESKTD